MNDKELSKPMAENGYEMTPAELQKTKESIVRKIAPEQRIADMLHMATCRHNHFACGYLYEKWDNPGRSKGQELRRVRALLKIVDEQTLEKIVLVLDRHS